MRVGNLDGRLVIVAGKAGREIGYDVEKSSGGQFSADPQAVYDVWGAFATWAAAGQFTDGTPVRPEALGSPAPAPRQVFGIGLNYREHAAESGFDAPDRAAGVHQVPELHHRPAAATSRCRPAARSTGRSSWSSSSAAAPHRVAADEALDYVAGLSGRPGRLRARAAAGRDAAAVQPGQVAARLRSDRPLAGHPRRLRRPR